MARSLLETNSSEGELMGRFDSERRYPGSQPGRRGKGVKLKHAQNVCSKCAVMPCVCEAERGRAAAARAIRDLAKADRAQARKDKRAAKAAARAAAKKAKRAKKGK